MAPSLAVGSWKPATSVDSIPGKSPPPPVRLRRHAANISTANKAMITAAGTHQLAATQSIQDPDSAGGATAGFFCTTVDGGGTGAGAEGLSTGGGTAVAVGPGGPGAGGGAAATDGAGLGWAGVAGAGVRVARV